MGRRHLQTRGPSLEAVWRLDSAAKLCMPQRSLRDYANLPFEIFIVSLSLVPFLVLAYFYHELPDRVPLFVNLKGDVSTWTEKSVLSVCRVPLMAVVTQIVCVLMKYGVVQSAPLETDAVRAKLHDQYLLLNCGLWDWFRWTVAFKMSAESVDTIFLSLARFNFLARPAFITSAVGAALGVVGALIYLYKLLAVRRKMKQEFRIVDQPLDTQHVYFGIIYFNRSSSVLFLNRYIFNFGNKWAWVFLACVVAYPLLALWPA